MRDNDPGSLRRRSRRKGAARATIAALICSLLLPAAAYADVSHAAETADADYAADAANAADAADAAGTADADYVGAYEAFAASRTPPADSVTVIGDSVTLGAERYANIKNRVAKVKGVSWCKVDSRGSRQLEGGLKLAKSLKKSGKLGDIVVFSLTTNGSFSYKQAKAAAKAVGKDRYVVFVTGYVVGYSYFNKSNKAVRKLAKEKSNVFVADWNKFIVKKKNKHLSDNYCHLNATSGRWYVDLVTDAVSEARAAHIAAYKKDRFKQAHPLSGETVAA
jgi:hypothetical protein